MEDNEQNKVEIKEKSNITPAGFISYLLTIRDYSHITHWQATTLSLHLAMEEIYTNLLEHTDKLVECYQSLNGIITEYSDIELQEYESVEPEEVIKDCIEYIKNNKEVISKDIALENIIQDMLGDLERGLYKIINLK